MTTKNFRTLLSGLFFLPYSFGYGLLALVAYWLRDWRHICYVCAGAQALVLVGWFWFLESPRWLSVSGRAAQAQKTFKQIAVRNGKKLEEDNVQWDTVFENISKVPNVDDFVTISCISYILVLVPQAHLSVVCGSVCVVLCVCSIISDWLMRSTSRVLKLVDSNWS